MSKLLFAQTLRLLLPFICWLACLFWSSPLAAQNTRDTAPPDKSSVRVTDVARELICPCPDCGKQALDQCPTCGEGQEYRAEISGLLKEGRTKAQIISYFGDKYGEHMLGNPRPKGVGLLAPIVPWAGAFTGLVIVLLVLRSSRSARRLREAQAAASTNPGQPSTPASDDPRLSAALKDFDY